MIINVAQVKKIVKEKNRRTGKDFIEALDKHVTEVVQKAVALESKKMTLEAEDLASALGAMSPQG